MKLTPLPTLQKMALLTLATQVHSIERYVRVYNDRIVQMIFEKMQSLGLPESLYMRLALMMKPVIVEICSWISYIRHIHEEVSNIFGFRCNCLAVIHLQETIRWQTVGLLDKEQTSLILIRDKRLDPHFRFVLACNCCSETDILRLWRSFSSDVKIQIHYLRFDFLPVVRYWTARLIRIQSPSHTFIPSPPFPLDFKFEYSYSYVDHMCSYYANLSNELRFYLLGNYGKDLFLLNRLARDEIDSHEFRSRVTVGLVNVDNVAAMKYFLQKFEPIRGQKFLEVVARNHFISNELLVFCLSKMSNDQVLALLRSGRRIRILSCFLNSPWQERFWDFMNHMWNEVTGNEILELFYYLLNFKIERFWFDYDYRTDATQLFRLLLYKIDGRHRTMEN